MPDVADNRKNTTRERLLALLIEKAVTFGDFTLASGRRSSYYLDSRLVTLDPEGAWLVAVSILDTLAREGIRARAIGGLTLGADPIAGAVAAVSHSRGEGMRGFIVRKQAKGHGTGRRIEGSLNRGDPVVVVDDVVTTAGSTLDAIRAVEEIGCVVAAVLCVVDRQEGGAEALKGYRFYPLFTAADLLAGRPGA
jgi:orotate phosphoribosyltransferase